MFLCSYKGGNKNKFEDEVVEVVKERRQWLEEEINEERIKQGKKPFEYKDEIEEKHIKVSKTDKESGYYHRDNKEKGFMYLDHRTVDDKCNIIVDAYITKGNVHDSEPFISRAEYIKRTFNFDIKKYAVDSRYITWDIKKYFIKNNIFEVFGYRRFGTSESRKENNKWSDKYVSAFKTWEENWDAICPFFQFSDEIRKIMYTTNTIESLNRQYRKFTKTKSVFPTDMALLKCLYLATKNIAKKWDQAYRNWGPILSELSIMFDGRI